MRRQQGVPRELLNRARTVNTTDDTPALSSDVYQRRGAPKSPVYGDVDEDEGREEPRARSSIVWRRGSPYDVGQVSRRTVMRVQHHPAIPPRASRAHTQEYQEPEPVATPERSGPRLHWLVYVGGAMLLMLLGWVLLSLLNAWWQGFSDDITYGRPRAFQSDALIDARTPSHFVAVNDHGRIIVFELVGDDVAKGRVITGPQLSGPGANLAPVTLQFKDVNHDGTLDMLIVVDHTAYPYINDHGTFRAPKPGESIDMKGGGS
jgi:hypothetical protein